MDDRFEWVMFLASTPCGTSCATTRFVALLERLDLPRG
jgi:hypothetical protein